MDKRKKIEENFLFIEKVLQKYRLLEIDNSKDSAVHGKWKNPGASLYNQLLHASWVPEGNSPDINKVLTPYHYLKETYLIAPTDKIHCSPYGITPYSRSGCKYPHHTIKGNKLVLHVEGLKAAYGRAKQMGIFKGEVKDHLEKHYKELGLYEDSNINESGKNEHNLPKEYDPPLEYDKLPPHLKKDPVHAWRAKTGIELIHKEPSLKELNRIWENWNLMTDEQKSISDKKSYEFFGKDNKTHYNELLPTYTEIDNHAEYEDSNINESTNMEDGEIRVPTREDYLNPKFVKWLLFKIEEFEDDEPETFDFSIFKTNPTVKNYVYGYFIDNIMRGIIRVLYDKNKKAYKVDMVFVDPDFHRKHIGSSLMQHVIDKFGKYDMLLYVFSNNTSAINLYKKFGFIIDSTTGDSSEKYKNKKQYIMIRKSMHESFEDLLLEDVELEDEETSEENPDKENPSAEEEKEEELEEVPEEENKEEPSTSQNISFPQLIDSREEDKNGINRKKLYIAFIEWCKSVNNKNVFGSVFDKDIFKTNYPFVPHEMRYFYRLANPMLCVLQGDLTFFQLSELMKVNGNNKQLSEYMIFAATPDQLRVFSNKDKKIYNAEDENGNIKILQMLGETFDLYIQAMVGRGDILHAPVEKNDEGGDNDDHE